MHPYIHIYIHVHIRIEINEQTYLHLHFTYNIQPYHSYILYKSAIKPTHFPMFLDQIRIFLWFPP